MSELDGVRDDVDPEESVTDETAEQEIEAAATSDEAEDSSETEAEETESEESSEEPPRKKGVQKRLDELTRLRYEAKREAERERSEREYWQRKAMGMDAESKPEPATAKPAVEQYQSYEEYLEALSDWKVEQRFAKADAEKLQETEQVSKAQKVAGYQSRVQAAQTRYEDYTDIAHGSHWNPTPEMTDAILESEMGPDLAYWLGSNPEEADRISRLSPVGQLREIGRIEERLSRPAPTPPKPTTKAPPPIKPGAPTGKAEKKPADMSDSEFAAWRRKQISARSGSQTL